MKEFTFPVQGGAGDFVVPVAGVDIGDDPAVAVALASSRAIVRPFSRDGRGGFVTGDYVARVTSTVGLIVGTRKGSFTADPNFGTLLHTLRQRPVNDATTDAIARKFVTDALAAYEPRARVLGVKMLDQERDGFITRFVNVIFNVVFRNAVLAREQSIEVSTLWLPTTRAKTRLPFTNGSTVSRGACSRIGPTR